MQEGIDLLKPICVPCERFMRMKKSGIAFVEGMPREGNAPPGKTAPELWRDYRLWLGDLYYCPTCSTEAIVGTGMRPISEHFKEDFGRMKESCNATLLVKDC